MSPQLPVMTNPWWALATLVVAAAGFHVWLVKLRPLDKLAWKKADYYWLSLTVLGVFSGVISFRMAVAHRQMDATATRLEGARSEVVDRVRAGHSPAVCRQFVRSEFSPPPEEFQRVQEEFDQLCAWFRAAQVRVDSSSFSWGNEISMELIGSASPPTGADQWFVDELQVSIDRYNAQLREHADVEAASTQSDLELAIAAFAPFLLAVGAALRITKVTGEIRLERREHAG